MSDDNLRHTGPCTDAAKLVGDDWRDVPITAGLLADIFDAYSGADGHNLVVIFAQAALRIPAETDEEMAGKGGMK